MNRALSAANSCLYGVCHAAIVAAGWSPALGFVHTGKMLSFVYDVADLYKTEVTIPAAFRAAAEFDEDVEGPGVETVVRHHCRDLFHETKLLNRIVNDIAWLFDTEGEGDEPGDWDLDPARPGGLWDPAGDVEGGANHAEAIT